MAFPDSARGLRAVRGAASAFAAAFAVVGGLAGPSAIQAAPQQRYLLFDGADDKVVVPDAPDFALTSAVTLEAWIRPTSLTPPTTQVSVLSKTSLLELSVSTGDTGCAFNTEGRVRWRAEIAGLARPICGGRLILGLWHHIAGTYDGAAFTLYVDGARVASASRRGAIRQGGYPFRIGNHPLQIQAFHGGIDEVRIWNRARTRPKFRRT